MNFAEFGNMKDFIARVQFALQPDDMSPKTRPLALLLGAGISVPSVPGVTQITMAIRKSLNEPDRPEFDDFLAAAGSSGEKYQRAFQYLARRRPPEYRNRIIQSSVLSAYSKASPDLPRIEQSELYEAELDVDNWELPDGISALGRIWTGIPAHLRGPAITTNFDPLLEISLRRAGMPAATHIIDGDGSLHQAPQLSENANVMHIHGFWREGATLSLMAELTRERPLLSASLRALLQRHTLLVFGYSGWKDAVTRALESLMGDNSVYDLDVLWCSYGDGPSLQTQLESNMLLAGLERSTAVQFYTGCDANKWIPELEASIAEQLEYSESNRGLASMAALPGFDLVTAGQFEEHDITRQSARAVSFLDGREPTIRDGFNPFIAQRDLVSTIYNQLSSRASADSPTLTLITGASGEGKSTLLVQLAARLASNSGGGVLFSRAGRLDASSALDIVSSRPTYVVIDEAQQSVSELKHLCRSLNEDSPRPLHIIAVARDTDWSAVGGFAFAWSNYIDYKDYRVRGLSHLDASSLVRTWEQLGEVALGHLAKYDSFDSKVGQLIHASKSDDEDRGTLFGASLEIRYRDGLQEHVRQLVVRLADMQSVAASSAPVGPERTLAYPLFLISIPQYFQIRGAPKALIAKALGISKIEFESFILVTLGDEAPVSVAGEHVEARHPAIARAVIDSAMAHGFVLENAINKLVSCAVETIDQEGYSDVLADFAYMSRKIDDTGLAVSAANAAHLASPPRLSYSARLSSAFRADGQPAQAIELGRESIENSWKAPDRRTALRVALNELGVSFGTSRQYAENVRCCLLSLSDISDLASFNSGMLEQPLTCLGLAGCNAWDSHGGLGYLRGVEAVLYVIDCLSRVDVHPEWMLRYRSTVRRAGGRELENMDEALEGFAKMAQECSKEGQEFERYGLPSQLRFSSLSAHIISMNDD